MKYSFPYCVLILFLGCNLHGTAQNLRADIYVDPYFDPAEYNLAEEIVIGFPKINYTGHDLSQFKHMVVCKKRKALKSDDGTPFRNLDYRIVIDLYENSRKKFRISL